MWVEGGGDIAAMTGGGARHIEAQGVLYWGLWMLRSEAKSGGRGAGKVAGGG
jgi:hypothetical protein